MTKEQITKSIISKTYNAQGELIGLVGKGKAHQFKKIVKKFGAGASHVILPFDWVGKTCTITLDKDQE